MGEYNYPTKRKMDPITAADLIAATDALAALTCTTVTITEIAVDLAKSYFGHLLSNIQFCVCVKLQHPTNPRTYYLTDLGIPLVPWFIPMIRSNIRDNATFKTWFQATRSRRQREIAKARIAAYKEELMAAAWHPRRVERLIAACGYDAID